MSNIIEAFRGFNGKTIKEPEILNLCYRIFLKDSCFFKEIVIPYLTDHCFLEVEEFSIGQIGHKEKGIEFFTSIPFPKLKSVCLEKVPLPTEFLYRLLSQDYMTQVESLQLAKTNLSDQGFETLMSFSMMPNLKLLGVAGNNLTDNSLKVLAKTTHFPKMESLFLASNSFKSVGTLIGAPIMENLFILDVENNAFEENPRILATAYPKLNVFL